MQKPIFYKEFLLYQEFSTKLKNKRENKNNIFGIIKSIIIFNDESVNFSDFGIIVKLNNIIYCFKNNKVYEYNPATNKQKIIFSTIGVIEFVIASNNKLYFSSNYENIYEYYLTTKQQKLLKIKDGINTGVVLNNKLYFGSNDGEVYEYNPATKQQKLLFQIGNIKSGIVLNNKVYFYSDFDASIYEYNPAKNEEKILMMTNGNFNFKFGFILNDKIYFGSWDSKVYEYDLTTKQQKLLKIKDGINNGIVLNNKLYFFNKNFYDFEPLELIKSDIVDLQEQIRRGVYLYYQEKKS